MSETGDQYELVAEGDETEETFNSKFNSIGKVRRIVGYLDSIGHKGDIKWKELIGNHKYFEPLKELTFPPLYSLSDFYSLSNDFWHDVERRDDDDDDKPGLSANWSRLYLKEDRVDAVNSEFEEFLQHLKSLSWLKEVV